MIKIRDAQWISVRRSEPSHSTALTFAQFRSLTALVLQQRAAPCRPNEEAGNKGKRHVAMVKVHACTTSSTRYSKALLSCYTMMLSTRYSSTRCIR